MQTNDKVIVVNEVFYTNGKTYEKITIPIGSVGRVGPAMHKNLFLVEFEEYGPIAFTTKDIKKFKVINTVTK